MNGDTKVKAKGVFWSEGKLIKSGAILSLSQRAARELVGSKLAEYVDSKNAGGKKDK
ncbi:MAG: hypothetical protein K0U59_02840 [Gammaproteobacteria bacterium]|nr:hypothetical protein [Gammaproteobacteria bacterium]